MRTFLIGRSFHWRSLDDCQDLVVGSPRWPPASAAAGPVSDGRVISFGRRSSIQCPGSLRQAARDVIDLTLIAAAARSGQADLVRALVTERITRKPSAAPSARALVPANGGQDA
jgi:hypothetical protein